MINLTISKHALGSLHQGLSTYVNIGVDIFNRTSHGLDAPNGNFSTGHESLNDTSKSNDTDLGGWSLQVYSEEHLIITSAILGLFVLCCIIGNCFVIAAVILERSLHNVANYLILSLAVADLMVAVLVMPLSVVSEISQVSFRSVCSVSVSCYSAFFVTLGAKIDHSLLS